MNSNPEKAIQAITNPAPLTLAQLALFEKIDAPVLRADLSSLRDNLIAVWIYKKPLREVSRNFDRREECALEMADKMSGEEYGEALTELVRACTAFYEMMPRKETGEAEGEEGNGETEDEGPKKALSGSATAGSRNLPNGSAGLTDIRPRSFFGRLARWIWRCCTGAGRKGQPS